MTIERLIAPERALPSHTVQEPRVLTSKSRVVQGGGFNGGDAGHKNYGQTIAHLFERRQEIRTSRYKDVPAGGTVLLKPDDTGAVSLRFAGGICPVTFALPPSVPEGQGSTRARQWSVRVRTFYAAETQLNWPANVVGAFGYDLIDPETEGGLQTLEEIGVLPAQPGMPTTGDTFELTYDERTGEWIVDWFSRNQIVEDPFTPASGTTDPNAPGATDGTTPTPPGDPSDPTDPTTEQAYTDPVTGEPMVPVQPPALAGDIIALHDGSVSYSTDGGSMWRQLNGSASAPVAISALLREGAVIVDSAGVARFSTNLQGWTDLRLATQNSIDIPLTNTDFETGDLTGWTTSSGTEPRVLATAKPAQMPGSKHYLTRNWTIFGTGDNALDQVVELDANTWSALQDGGSLRLSSDVYAGSLASGKIQILDGGERLNAAESFNLYRTSAGFRADEFAVSPTQGPLRLVGAATAIAGSWDIATSPIADGIRLDGAAGANISGSVAWRVEKADGSLYDGVVSIRLYDLDGPNGASETLRVGGLDRYDVAGGGVTAAVQLSGDVLFTGVAGNAGSAGTGSGSFTVSVVPEFSFLYTGRDLAGLGMKGFSTTAAELVLAETTWADDTWKRVAATLPGLGVPASKIRVRLVGAGNGTSAADAYFDNVKLEVSLDRSEAARTVAPDYAFGRHVIASQFSLYAVRAGVAALLSSCPISSEHIAADGPQIIVAAGSSVRVSWNDGQTWTAYTAPGLVRQLFAGRSAAFISEAAPTGTVVAVTAGGDVMIIDRTAAGPRFESAGAGTHFSIDGRRGTFVSTESTGNVDGVNQPASVGAVGRRTLPCDNGRWLGYQFNVRDLFYTADPMGPWLLAPSLAEPILDLIEVR
jgi:hypothetical protein